MQHSPQKNSAENFMVARAFRLFLEGWAWNSIILHENLLSLTTWSSIDIIDETIQRFSAQVSVAFYISNFYKDNLSAIDFKEIWQSFYAFQLVTCLAPPLEELMEPKRLSICFHQYRKVNFSVLINNKRRWMTSTDPEIPYPNGAFLLRNFQNSGPSLKPIISIWVKGFAKKLFHPNVLPQVEDIIGFIMLTSKKYSPFEENFHCINNSKRMITPRVLVNNF